MNKKIIVDCDGVLLNWYDPFLEYHGFTSEEFKQLEQDDPRASIGLVGSFNKSARIGFLEPMNDQCEWGMKYLSLMGYEIHCLTAFGGNEWSQKLREENIRRFFPMVRTVTFLDLESSKKEKLEAYKCEPGTPYIEDHIRHAYTGDDLGFKSFLINRFYNQKDERDSNIIRVDDWPEIIKEIM